METVLAIFGAIGGLLAIITFATKQREQWTRLSSVVFVVALLLFLFLITAGGALALANEVPDITKYGWHIVLVGDACLGVALGIILVGWIAGHD